MWRAEHVARGSTEWYRQANLDPVADRLFL
jgi:hypothetical protein